MATAPLMSSSEHNRLEEDQRRRSSERITRMLKNAGRFLKRDGADVKLSVMSKDGFSVCMKVDMAVLVDKSRFFKEKLDGDGGWRRRRRRRSHTVEIICEYDDVEVYVEVLVLMHCCNRDLKIKLRSLDVSEVLGLLKVSAALMFDVGIASCLEHLEAVTWSAEEEEEILLQLNQLPFSESVSNVLKRLVPTSSKVDDIVSRLITGVLSAKDGKARREMKSLMSMLLREESYGSWNRVDVSESALYDLGHRCLSSLILCLSEATSIDESRQEHTALMGEIAQEVDNILWLVDILLDMSIGEEFVKLWADQKDLATLHSKIPVMYRHDVSRITAHLCIAIGRGQVLVPKEIRSCLLSTWLQALYDDFKWMMGIPNSVDRNLVEHGLGMTILTLPLRQQQSIFLVWFDRFLNKGDDCPNIKSAFEIWWRRAFYPTMRIQSQRITVADCSF